MAEPNRNEYKQDLVLNPDEYAFLQDTGKGALRVYKGPTVTTPSASDVPVVYDAKRGFVRCGTLQEAIRKSPTAPEGHYITLLNPSKSGGHPDENTHSSPELNVGRRINIFGPEMFALWPGQVAEVIQGHHLRSNQWLLIKVYNQEEARKNWGLAIQKAADGSDLKGATAPKDLADGKLYVIKGTDVAFYMPPTGISVVPEGHDGTKKKYVRDALTLERLEYAILIDENGRKRYERGPAVVFPEPTEKFMEKRDKETMRRKFTAIELNAIQGLHLKVIAPYKDEDGTEHEVGEELFITGKDTSIYYPREEHAEIRYDGKSKHFASAVPKGEARYILDRLTGKISKEAGPAMLLPDPRFQVFVRRVLSLRECELLYPGNIEVSAYNQALQAILANAPTTRSGAISEGDFERGVKDVMKSGGRAARGAAPAAVAAGAYLNSMSYMPDSSSVSKDTNLVAGDEFSRASTYTDPRTITLNTKYQGSPRIDVWTGYAVQVVSKDGSRRVEVGPKSVLLEYDETLEALSLSTGKPKTTDVLLPTAYLRVENNQVSDEIRAVTSDHVAVVMKLSYLVNFEGDVVKWFSAENYVKLLTDHIRSVLKSAIRQVRVEEFYASAETTIRDIILGKSVEGKRTGMKFIENGMVVKDVEVLSVIVGDDEIRKMLDQYQHEVIRSNIQILTSERNLEVATKNESFKQQLAELQSETAAKQIELAIEAVGRDLSLFLEKVKSTTEQLSQEAEISKLKIEVAELNFANGLDQRVREHELEQKIQDQDQQRVILMLQAEKDSLVERFNAIQGPFSASLNVLSNNETLEKVAQALSAQMLFGGKNVADVVTNVFKGTPLEAVMVRVMEGVGKSPSNGGTKPELRPTR